MCGRFALHAHPDVVKLQFGLATLPDFSARYNIAPTVPVLVVRQGGAATLKWGLVPHWAKDSTMGARMNNARAETVAEKPAFRDAYRSRRCLIPASGFYEWKSEFGLRQPYYVHPAEGELFAFAGLWERWRDLETCAVLTTDANAKMAAVHDRMPVIVARTDYAAWLGGREEELRALLKPCPDASIEVRRVSRAVNNARNEDPALIEPEKR